MLDLHCHILPGVDDGSKDMETSIEMAKLGKKYGIKNIIATPHYIEGAGYNNAIINKKILNKLNTELIKNDIDVNVYLGNEVYITPELITLLENRDILSINDGRYILIELPTMDIPLFTENIIYKLRLRGNVPIIAHPERNMEIIENPNRLYNLIKLGALTQVNLPSIVGWYGETVQNTALNLLKYDMIHFIGTDGHRAGRGYVNVKVAIDIMTKLIAKEKLDKILYRNPKLLLNNEDIMINDPLFYRKVGWIKKLLNKVIRK